MRTGRIWFLRNGSHLCRYDSRHWWGSAADEYGRKTWWVYLGLGVLVVASKGVVYPDVANEPLP